MGDFGGGRRIILKWLLEKYDMEWTDLVHDRV
jgi:hypothetical protein